MTRSRTSINAIDAINHRTSIRAYTAEKVDPPTVRMLLTAATRAPTALHEEPWAFLIMQDVDALKRLSDMAKPVFLTEMQRAHLDRGGHSLSDFARPEFNIFYNASTLIVICGKSSARFAAPDCWLAAENLILAACSIGLGTCVIGTAVSGLNNPEVKDEVGIPRDMQAIVPIIVGVPDEENAPRIRKEPRILSWNGNQT